MTEEAPPTPAEGGKQDLPVIEAGKTFTQDEVNALVAREKGNLQRKYEGYDDLKAKAARLAEIEAANQSEVEKATTKTQKAEQRASDAEAKLLRYEVATEKKVPAEAVELLTGTTREELEANADKLLALVKTGVTPPEFDGGAREPAPEPDTPEMAHGKLITSVLTGESVQANP